MIVITPLLLTSVILAASPVHDVLQTTYPVWDVSIGDVNGDGFNDISAICSVEGEYPPEKHLTIFWGDETGGFDSRRMYDFILEPGSGNLFFTEIDGQSPSELVILTTRGFSIYTYQNEKFIHGDTIPIVSVYPVNTREPHFLKDLAADLDGDGKEEWVVAVPGGYQIWNANGKTHDLSADIASEVEDIGGEYITLRIPQLFVTPQGETDEPVLAFLSDRVADFHHGENWKDSTQYRIPQTLEQRWDAHASLKDINMDGWPDLMVTQTEGTINMNVLTQIYIGQPSFTYSPKPEFQIESKGGFSAPTLVDVNNDQLDDIVVVSIPLSLRNIANFLIRKKVSVRIDIHLHQKGGFSSKPSFRTYMTMEAPDGRERFTYAWGDYNNDGYLDAAIGSGSENLHIYIRTEKELLSTKPWKSFDIPAFGVARARNIDGEGGDDLILFHPGVKDSRRIDVLRFTP